MSVWDSYYPSAITHILRLTNIANILDSMCASIQDTHTTVHVLRLTDVAWYIGQYMYIVCVHCIAYASKHGHDAHVHVQCIKCIHLDRKISRRKKHTCETSDLLTDIFYFLGKTEDASSMFLKHFITFFSKSVYIFLLLGGGGGGW